MQASSSWLLSSARGTPFGFGLQSLLYKRCCSSRSSVDRSLRQSTANRRTHRHGLLIHHKICNLAVASDLHHHGKKKKLAQSLDSNSPVRKASRKMKKARHNANVDAAEKELEKNDGDQGPLSPRREEENLNSMEISFENKKKKKMKNVRFSNCNDANVYAAEKELKKNDCDQGPLSPRRDEENLNSMEISFENKKKKKKKKKVRFSNYNDVLHLPKSVMHSGDEYELVIGKRYSEEEDQIILDAIAQYLKEHNMGEDDGYMLFNRKEYPQVRGCWKEIYAAIPWRHRGSVYVRAELLLHKWVKRSWTREEIELVKRYRQERGKGCRWKELSEHLGRHRHHIKDAWRRYRLPNRNSGRWSQEEYQQLFDLVNMDLRMKSFHKVEFRNKMLRENISWMAVSDKLATRHHGVCCQKWYEQLASPMVAKGLWNDSDDYRLLDALSELDASCVEDVDWDSLVENRSAEFCLQRWKEMTRHIGGKKERSFVEQVEILSSRYCSDMIQYRTGGDETR